MPPRHDTHPEPGTAGASARAEYERRRRNREARTRARHARLGGLFLALSEPPQHERNWERGAEAEEAVARSLARRCRDDVVLLHDRRLPGKRANIDHIAVAPSGVWVIDTKCHRGKAWIRKPLFGKATLEIDGRDKTALIDALAKQVAAVREALSVRRGAAPVHGALCFVEADLPLFGTLSINGFLGLYPRQLAKRLNAPGLLTVHEIRAVAQLLAERFPVA
jgi:hypothetical protein